MKPPDRFDKWKRVVSREDEVALLVTGIALASLYYRVPAAPVVVPPGTLTELLIAGYTNDEISRSEWWNPRTLQVEAGPWIPTSHIWKRALAEGGGA